MAIRGIFGKKKKLGFAEKQRTREEVDREYHHHATMYGHISRLMHQDHLVLEQNQKLLDEHLEAMVKLNKEGQKLPPPPKAETQPEPTPPEAA